MLTYKKWRQIALRKYVYSITLFCQANLIFFYVPDHDMLVSFVLLFLNSSKETFLKTSF